jgi:hypothetical protein
MTRFAATIVISLLVAGSARAGGETKVPWMKLDAAREMSNSTGKPILVYAGFT